jgi:DNA-binding MarR family transcriptional regulator
LIEAILDQGRQSSTISVMHSQAVADRVGLNPSDVESLDILRETGPITAGRLAELTGLTTGAITGMVDRLERAGYVRRERDTEDRRRVIIHPFPDPEKAEREMIAAYRPMLEKLTELTSSYTNEELIVLLDYFSRANAIVEANTRRLRGMETSDATTGDTATPREAARSR